MLDEIMSNFKNFKSGEKNNYFDTPTTINDPIFEENSFS